MSTTTVGTVAELDSALRKAGDGDEILLRPGVYSNVEVKFLSFANGITISSADPSQKAVLTNFVVNEVDGVTFRGIEILVSGPGSYGANIYSSQNVTFERVYVHGSLDGDASNDPDGIGFLGSSNIRVTNSEFTELRQALGVGGVATNIVVADNYAHLMMKAGFVFSGVSNVRITGNVITDIRPVGGAHPDAIQFFTSGTTVAAHDILIANNAILKGAGAATQGIFMRDESTRLPYSNVQILNNLIVGTGYGGIYVDGAKYLTISGNELTSNPGETNRTFLLAQRVDQALLSDNRAVSIGDDQATNLTKMRNTVTSPVTDEGAAAVTAWVQAHPDIAAAVARVSLPYDVPIPSGSLVQALAGTMAADTIPGSNLADRISDPGGSNYLRGLDGDDTASGGSDFDDINGNAGNDTISGGGGDDWVVGGKDNDLLFGDGGADLVYGNLGDDTCEGGYGNDTIRGGQGADVLHGGGGADFISGDRGDDTIAGGSGADIFHGSDDAGLDRIVDFSVSQGDRIQIDPGATYSIAQVGADTVITLSGGQILLVGVAMSSLTSSSIFLA